MQEYLTASLSQTQQQVYAALFACINNSYNTLRTHSVLEDKSPVAYKKRTAKVRGK